jgi:hypothetical protein
LNDSCRSSNRRRQRRDIDDLEQDSPFLQERTTEMSYAQSAQPAQEVGLGRPDEANGPKSGLVVSNELRH